MVKRLIPAVAKCAGQTLPNSRGWILLVGDVGNVYLATGNPVTNPKFSCARRNKDRFRNVTGTRRSASR